MGVAPVSRAAAAHPGLAAGLVLEGRPLDAYWSAEQTEWATDVMFRDRAALAAVYPGLVRHGMLNLSCGDVMRFLGRKVPAHGGANGHFAGEAGSDLATRPEGVRLKHRVGANSVKVYDKQGSVLRVETTINDLIAQLDRLSRVPVADLLSLRYERFRAFGDFVEPNGGAAPAPPAPWWRRIIRNPLEKGGL